MSPLAFAVISAVLAVQCIDGVSIQSNGLVLATASQDDQNTEFDAVLSTLSSLVEEASLNEFQMNDVNLPFLTIDGGVLSDLSQLKRVGDATVTTDDDGKVTMSGQITVSDLQVKFTDFSFCGFGSGNTTFKFTTNTIDVELQYSGNSTECSTSVEKFDLTELKGYTVKFDTFSLSGTIFSWVAPLFLNSVSSLVIFFVGSEPQALAQVLLSRGELCSL